MTDFLVSDRSCPKTHTVSDHITGYTVWAYVRCPKKIVRRRLGHVTFVNDRVETRLSIPTSYRTCRIWLLRSYGVDVGRVQKIIWDAGPVLWMGAGPAESLETQLSSTYTVPKLVIQTLRAYDAEIKGTLASCPSSDSRSSEVTRRINRLSVTSY